MNYQAYVDEVVENGYAVMENAISDEFCDEIVAEILRLEAAGVPPTQPNTFLGYNTVRFYDLLNKGEVWQRVATHPHLLPVLRGVLGDDMLLSIIATSVIGPGEPAQLIHCDDLAYEIPMPHRALVCNTIWALTPFTEERGATRLVPGSHRWTDPPDPTGTIRYESIPLVMPKGSVCFLGGSLFHGGGANRSAERRFGLTVNYCGGMLRQEENIMLAVSRELAASLTDELRALIGYRPTKWGFGAIDGEDPGKRLLAR